MAFWSKLGKGLLKVGKVAAPIALGMTGVGLPAAMAVSGGLNALDKKASGGSWKGALGAGLMGAGSAYGASKLGGFAGKLAGKLGKGATTSSGMPSIPVQSGLPADFFQKLGQKAAPSQSAFQRIMGNIGQGARTAQDVMGAVGAARGAMGGYRTPPFNPYGGGITGGMGGMRTQRGMGVPRMDQRSPNLAYPIMRGRQEAIMNQPWRTPPFNPDPTQQMPNIYPNIPNMDIWEPQGRGIGPSYMPNF